MAKLNMNATPEAVWAVLREVAALQKETDKIIKEYAAERKKNEATWKENEATRMKAEATRMKAEAELAEERKKAEAELAKERKITEHMMRELDVKLDKLEANVTRVTANVGGLNNDIGAFAEGLLTSDLFEIFTTLGLDFDTALHNVVIRERGTKRKLAELDCLLFNPDEALIIEVKARLTIGDIEKHLTRIKILSEAPNDLIGGKKLYGAVAGIKIREKTKDYAKKKGLFVMEPSGDTVNVEMPVGEPAVW
ncbi:MAG: hypothetical protein LBT01_08005 [Spirochaetaceae bacterium]|jgi:hypothetical protein|nr:hypothetical protein [Spirochaetaceae bacterium]